jgi:acetyltransferase
MIAKELINPQSIVIVGGSDNLNNPGGRIIQNLTTHHFKGELYVVNPKKDNVQGLPTYKDVADIPENVDVAIIAIASKYVEQTVKILTEQKNTKGFIIISAGFSDVGEQGRALEERIVAQIKKHNGTLLGPNNIGLINRNYAGVFTTPVPKLDAFGVDMISGSGATAVFIIEAAMQIGLTFNSIWTVGNSAQIGVEEVLEFLDETHTQESPKVKMLYIESIQNPKKLLKHGSSLIEKGCKMVAVKAGSSEAGSRAASSHTGALASSDLAVETLFDKAGIIRAYGREEMINIAGVLQYGLPKSNRVAIVTHAGGPGVMLTDVLEKNRMQVPAISGEKAASLKEKLFAGSSVENPIDFLATGTANHLDEILTACENDFDNIDAVAVIFGSPGLFQVYDVYDVLAKHIAQNKKPIYPILPSVVNVADEIKYFHNKNKIGFPDEVVFGKAFAKAYHNPDPDCCPTHIDVLDRREILVNIDNDKGYLSPEKVHLLLSAYHIPVVSEGVFEYAEEAILFADNQYPIVMKVVGPLHKTDVGGVLLGIQNKHELKRHFDQLMQIDGAEGVMIQPQKKGIELFIGVKKEEGFGHLILFGMGGVFIEVLKDFQSILAPESITRIVGKINKLKAYPLLKGIRGKEGVDIEAFAELIQHVAMLVNDYPQIVELDLNPILANTNQFYAVDARIKLA